MLEQTELLFAHHAGEAARAAAIDQLHHATAIYTAEGVVDELLHRLHWPAGARRLVDPSCGDGMFVGRALLKLLHAGDPGDRAILDTVQGWEIHPFACSQARARICGILHSAGRTSATAARMAHEMVRNADFLIDGPTSPAFHVVAGNPPYLRWLNVPSVLRDDYAQHVPAYAAADMLHSFLDRCAATLHANGEIAFVTSDRWLFSDRAAKLRGLLGQRLSIQHLSRLSAKSCFYRPKNRRSGTPPRIHPVAVHLSHASGRKLTAEAIYPGVDAELYRGMPTLGDIAQVRLAPWLGAHGIFLVTAEEAAASCLPADVLVPAVDTDDIVDGALRAATRYAIRTVPTCAPCAVVAGHLERNMHRMAKRGLSGKIWMPPEGFHRFDLSKQSLLVPRIAKTPASIRVPAGHLPINHNLSIVCDDVALLARIEKALSGEIAATWLRGHAAPLEGGYFALTASLLRKIPIDLQTGATI